MAAYKDLVGQKITKVTSNPGEPKTGQMWYNSTTGTLKGLGVVEAWASAANQTQTQRDGGYGQSTPSSASWFAGGVDASRNSTTTQEWNGTGWSNGGNINVGREEATGFGLVNAAALAGGSTYPPSALKNEVEEYDGSSWTAVTALPAKRKQAAGAGTQTAGLVSFGAVDPPSAAGSINATALEYDGSSWTSGGTGNTARSQISGCGTQTAALAFGGHTSPTTTFPAATEEYDGSTWTTSGAMNTGRGLMAGNGIQTSALAYAGFTPYRDLSEKYDGTTWSNTPTLATARDRAHGGGPNSSNGLCAGGLTSPGVISVVEEFTSSTSVITGAAWASGGAYPSPNYGLQGAGSKTAALAWGGDAGGATTNTTAKYDGSSWTTSGNYPFNGWRIGGDGTQTAAIGSGGVNNSSDLQSSTNTFDGSSWTAGTSLPAGRRSHAHVGTTTASVVFGGTPVSTTLEYDGSSYSSAPALATPRAGMHALGIQTAALCGATPPSLATEEYDGSSWTTGGSQVKAVGSSAEGNGTGTQTAGMFVGGYPGIATTQIYDGTSFITSADLGTGGYGIGQSSSSSTAAVVFGRISGGYKNLTEEFTGETETANIADFTTS